ncbi:MAG: alkaline phosphatase [Verrucomicrobiales bacterium]|nr:alkaline phosphatase [Verrucomicrobiales bacterium]
MTQQLRRLSPTRWLGLAGAIATAVPALAAPTITRLTPPSALFSFGDPNPPVIARFLSGQRFDLQATIQADADQSIEEVKFLIDGNVLAGSVAFADADATAVTTDIVAGLRAQSVTTPGVHTLTVSARQSDGQTVSATGNFEIVRVQQAGRRAKNIICLIGDGMGIAHRTAARLMLHGAALGKANAKLAMDQFPETGMVITHSLNSIVTDSSPGSHCYSTGNKANNNQHGVFPDDTRAVFDNPRIEYMGEYLKRTQGKSLGLVTTSDVFDATPAAWATHTQSRGAGTGICDQYLDDRNVSGLTVLLGGGRKWFLPKSEPGSQRSNNNDYVLPSDIVAGWGAAQGALDEQRNLIGDFIADGWHYASDAAGLASMPAGTTKLLGLFSLSNMNVAKDKIDHRRNDPAARNGEGGSFIVEDYGFPDQPMLDEMTSRALEVLNRNRNGFVLMVEAASIDKQAHNMDTERWILDTIEFDRAIAVCQQFAQQNPDTLVIVTADHECAGVNIIGASLVSNADLRTRAAAGGGASQLRAGVVGTYESAGFPSYTIGADGYPQTTDIDRRMLIGYAANADRNEDWITNPRPLRDSQQPFNSVAPLNTYPTGPNNRDVEGAFAVTGQINDPVAAHTASDVPVSAMGRGSSAFRGLMDNTDVFFKAMQAVLGGSL